MTDCYAANNLLSCLRHSALKVLKISFVVVLLLFFFAVFEIFLAGVSELHVFPHCLIVICASINLLLPCVPHSVLLL